MTQKPMARLPWLIEPVLNPYEILTIAKENKYLEIFWVNVLILSLTLMFCVLIRITLLNRFY